MTLFTLTQEQTTHFLDASRLQAKFTVKILYLSGNSSGEGKIRIIIYSYQKILVHFYWSYRKVCCKTHLADTE